MKTDRDRIYSSEGNGSFSLKDFKSIGDNVFFESGALIFHPENITLGRNAYIGLNSIYEISEKLKSHLCVNRPNLASYDSRGLIGRSWTIISRTITTILLTAFI